MAEGFGRERWTKGNPTSMTATTPHPSRPQLPFNAYVLHVLRKSGKPSQLCVLQTIYFSRWWDWQGENRHRTQRESGPGNAGRGAARESRAPLPSGEGGAVPAHIGRIHVVVVDVDPAGYGNQAQPTAPPPRADRGGGTTRARHPSLLRAPTHLSGLMRRRSANRPHSSLL